MPDLYDPDHMVDPRPGSRAATADKARFVAGSVGFVVALIGIGYGLATGFNADTLLFAVAGLVVFAALALTCALDLLLARNPAWPARSLLGSLLGLSLLRLLGVD